MRPRPRSRLPPIPPTPRPPRSSSRRPTRPRSLPLSWPSSLLLLLSLLLSALSLVVGDSTTPRIDFDSLGNFGAAGAFAGLTWADTLPSANVSDAIYPAGASSIVTRHADGTITKLASTNPGGRVAVVCQFPTKGTLFFGGRFDTVADVQALNVVSYDPASNTFAPLGSSAVVGGSGLDGQVNVLYCDEAGEQVFAGGDFHRPIPAPDPTTTPPFQGNVAVWSTANQAWMPPLFGGLDGPVLAISPGTSPSSIRFMGNFTVTYQNTSDISALIPALGINSTLQTLTDVARTRSGAVLAAGNAAANAGPVNPGTDTSPLPATENLAPISLASATLSATGASDLAGFGDPNRILCPEGGDGPGNSFLMRDGTGGSLTARWYRQVFLRGFRLANTHYQGRGLTTFSISATPLNQVLSLIYYDPGRKQIVQCTNNCTLSTDASIPYQDFLIAANAPGVTNGTISADGFTVHMAGWTGAGPGLHLLEALSDGGITYAVDSFNRGSCNSTQPGINGTDATAVAEGGWYQTMAPGVINGADQWRLAAQVPVSDAANENPTVTFYPQVPSVANYTIYLFTPGCTEVGTCAERGQIQTVVSPGSVGMPTTTTVSQTNAQDEYMPIYNGPLEATNGGTSSPVHVRLSLPPNPSAPSGGNTQHMVADHIRLVLHDQATLTSLTLPKLTGYGVFEFNGTSPAFIQRQINATGLVPINATDSESQFDLLGVALADTVLLRNERSAITGAVTVGGLTYVSGKFASGQFSQFGGLTAPIPSGFNTTATSGHGVVGGGATASAGYRRGSLAQRQVAPIPVPASSSGSSAAVPRAGVPYGGNGTATSQGPLWDFNLTSSDFNVSQAIDVSFANVVAFDGTNLVPLPNGGLNGEVNSIVAIDTYLYLGGSFTQTADGLVVGLPYVIRYDTVARQWAALPGLNGPVWSLSVSGTQIFVMGSFTDAPGAGASSGLAIWDHAVGQWVSQPGFLSGTLTSSLPTTNKTDNTAVIYLAGAILGVSDVAAPGVLNIAAPKNKTSDPGLVPLNFTFKPVPGSSASGSVSSSAGGAASSNPSRRSEAQASVPSHAVGHRRNVFDMLWGRAASSPGHLPARSGGLEGASNSAAVAVRDGAISSQALSSLRAATTSSGPSFSSLRLAALSPISLDATGDNEVYAGAFWSDPNGAKHTYTIVGGNFTTTDGVVNLGLYDDQNDTLTSFPPHQSGDRAVVTVVRALSVVDNMVYVGGEGGIEAFDLVAKTWMQNFAPLQASSGSNNLTVTGISHRPNTGTVVVSGDFGSAGSLPCQSICMWDTGSGQWSALGAGISGTVNAIDFAANKADQLIVGGDITLPDGSETAVGSYDFNAQAWTALGSMGSADGQVPGPATALSVDNLNQNAIFVAGRTSDDTTPYLVKWDGQRYDAVSQELVGPTGVQQLTFVPLLENHNGNNVLESDRMLLVSGSLVMSDFGNVSSALFDGASWRPFLLASSSTGGMGVIRSFFRSNEVLTFSSSRHLAVGIVILVSIAIGLGVVFFVVLVGLLVALARRSPKYDQPPAPVPVTGGEEYKDSNNLLATLQQATAVAAAGGVVTGAAAAAAAAGARHDHGHTDEDEGYDSHSQIESYEGLVGGAAGAGAASTTEGMGSDEGVTAYARYSFEATHLSELSLHAGQQLQILDDQDSSWWLARDATGRTGVVPATYLI